MAITVNTNGPVIELGTWISGKGNSTYESLLTAHLAEQAAGTVSESAEFNAMVNEFLSDTNQSIS